MRSERHERCRMPMIGNSIYRTNRFCKKKATLLFFATRIEGKKRENGSIFSLPFPLSPFPPLSLFYTFAFHLESVRFNEVNPAAACCVVEAAEKGDTL